MIRLPIKPNGIRLTRGRGNVVFEFSRMFSRVPDHSTRAQDRLGRQSVRHVSGHAHADGTIRQRFDNHVHLCWVQGRNDFITFFNSHTSALSSGIGYALNYLNYLKYLNYLTEMKRSRYLCCRAVFLERFQIQFHIRKLYINRVRITRTSHATLELFIWRNFVQLLCSI